MTLAKVKARANKKFIVQASLVIVTYDGQKNFIVQATDVSVEKLFSLPLPKDAK